MRAGGPLINLTRFFRGGASPGGSTPSHKTFDEDELEEILGTDPSYMGDSEETRDLMVKDNILSISLEQIC